MIGYVNNKFESFNKGVETTLVSFEKATEKRMTVVHTPASGTSPGMTVIDESDPWKTTFPGYIANLFINPILTVYHAARTVERVVKTIINLALGIFSGLGALALCGQNEKMNRYAMEKLAMSALHLYATLVSFVFILGNLGSLLVSLVDSRQAIKNEVWLVQQQNKFNQELAGMPAFLQERLWPTKS